jgi:Tfp pilus assembly protein PilV
VTLLEVLISLGLVVIGMLGMFASLSTATNGSSAASRLSQAQARAQAIVEAIRVSPAATLDCLATTPANNWAGCELTGAGACLTNLGSDAGAPSADFCVYTPASMARWKGPPAGGGVSPPTNQSLDRQGQPYQLVYDSTTPLGPRSSFVQKVGPSGRVYDIQVTIGWNDDGTAGGANPKHVVTMRTGVFQ